MWKVKFENGLTVWCESLDDVAQLSDMDPERRFEATVVPGGLVLDVTEIDDGEITETDLEAAYEKLKASGLLCE